MPGLDCPAPDAAFPGSVADGGMGIPGLVADGAGCGLLPDPDAGGVPLPEPVPWASAGPAITATPTIPTAHIIHRCFM
jgi:hypothetical protein